MANSKISALTSATTPLAGTEVLPIVQSSTTKQVSVANLTAGRAVAALSLSTTSGFTFRGADNTLYEILRYIGSAGKNPGLFGKVVDSTTSAYFGSASSSGADILYLGTSSTSQQTLKFDTAGDTTFLTGNVIQGTAAKGINFTANTPAAGMTSQLLNWYEEGSWTPVVTDGTTDLSMASGAGWYIKIGKNVTVGWNSYSLDVSTLNSTAQLRIKTLPFTAAAKDTWSTANFPYNNSGKNITQRIPASSTQIYFFVSGASTVDYDNCSRTTLGGTSISFFGSMTYFSA